MIRNGETKSDGAATLLLLMLAATLMTLAAAVVIGFTQIVHGLYDLLRQTSAVTAQWRG